MLDAKKSAKLVEFAEQILYKKSLPEGLPHISSYAKDIIGAERCSMFIYSPSKHELWTTLADGVERITIPSDYGIVGKTLETKTPIIENDPYSNPLFSKDVDKKTGYLTKNIITHPLFNTRGEIVGVLELLNKEDGFNADDLKYMKFFSQSLSDFIDLVNLYEK